MIKSLARRFSRKIGTVFNFFGPDETEDLALEEEKNQYKRNIMQGIRKIEIHHGDHLNVPIPAVVEAINMIGCLAYTGGPPANNFAGQQLDLLINVFRESKIDQVKIAIMKSISTISRNHSDHQMRCYNLGFMDLLFEEVCQGQMAARKWAIQCMVSLMMDNVKILKVVKEKTELHSYLSSLSNESWSGFQHNYGQLALELTGLKPLADSKATIDKQGENDSSRKMNTICADLMMAETLKTKQISESVGK